MSLIITDPATVCLADDNCRLTITVQDTTVSPAINADPAELRFILMDPGGTVLGSDIYPSPASRIVRTAVGKFYIDIGPYQAKLNGAHAIGATTINVDTANPLTTNYWPETGNLILDKGIIGSEERVSYSSRSIAAGTGTFTLSSPTTKAHSDDGYVIGPNAETSASSELLIMWRSKLNSSDEYSDSMQRLRVVSPKVASYIPQLRQIIDKSHKLVDTANECFLGYTDSQLINYLDGGVSTINAYQPYTTFSIENFPDAYKQILLDSALIVGVTSQQLYAIDTDIPNYNDNGTSFVINHQPQLASFLNHITQRLDKLIPMMKLQMIQSGRVHVQMGPNFRLSQVVEASPSGSLFRNIWFKG